MKRTIWISLLLLPLLLGPLSAWAEDPPVPSIPATPAAIDEVLYARTFQLTEAYKFEWRKEQPEIKEGTILVLKVNPDLVYPRQIAEPVLYVGNQTAERVNIGNKSGHVIAIVPGRVDLEKTPIWFGTPELPEQVTEKTIQAERKMADKAGIKPASAAKAADANKKGGERLTVKDRFDLRQNLAPLMREYAADEVDLLQSLEIPREKPAP
jgi:hypothetical protein